MAGFLTVCFSDWNADKFRRGVMRIKDGVRTNRPIRRPLQPDEIEGIHYCIKPDPDFERGLYRVCHLKLRQVIEAGDVLFFRTLWRGQPYLIGYFWIAGKSSGRDDPVCLADLSSSRLIDFSLEITPSLIRKVNPRAALVPGRHFNHQVTQAFGRNYIRLSDEATDYLIRLIEQHA